MNNRDNSIYLKLAGVLAFLCISIIAFPQKEDLIIELDEDQEYGYLQFDNPKGSVTVTGYEGNVIIVNGVRRFITDNSDTKITDGRNNRPGFILSAEEKDNNVIIITESYGNTIDFNIRIPSYMSLKIKCLEDGNVSLYRINGDIEVINDFGDIFAGDISGSSVFNSTYGNIKVSFKDISTDKPSMFTSFDGDIELLFPQDGAASFKIRSHTGRLLTSLELVAQDQLPVQAGGRDIKSYTLDSWTEAALNGGGSALIISTYSGNIILKSRKDVTF